MIPVPGLGVDGLPHASQDLERGLVWPTHMLIPAPNQRPDQGGCRVELRDLQANLLLVTLIVTLVWVSISNRLVVSFFSPDVMYRWSHC